MEDKQQQWIAYFAMALAVVAILIGVYLTISLSGVKGDLAETNDQLNALETKNSASQALPSGVIPFGSSVPGGGIPEGAIECGNPEECEQMIRELDPNAQIIGN